MTTQRSADEEAVPLEASERTAALVERLCDQLGLWRHPTEAALFLAALAVARDAEPVEVEPSGELVVVGTLDGAFEELAIFGMLDGQADQPAAVREDRLSGWIEAGAELLAPRLDNADVAEAVTEVTALLDVQR